MKVKEIMTDSLLQSCTPETKLHNAAKAMKKGNCGALPVLDKSRKVVGMVTDRDICLSLASKHPKTFAERNVGDIISVRVISVKPEDELSTALRQMRLHQIGRLPVVDSDGKLKGMLSIHNLLSKSLNGMAGFGKITSPGENLAKTLKAMNDHYSLNSQPKAREISAGRRISWEEAM